MRQVDLELGRVEIPDDDFREARVLDMSSLAEISMAISLKRIADTLTFGNDDPDVSTNAICNALGIGFPSDKANFYFSVIRDLQEAGFKVVRK